MPIVYKKQNKQMNDSKINKNINYAIVETTRPAVYTSMKYWGKKPHNVWHDYIKNYVPENGVFMDPFCGSGMSGIEAIRAGRKAACFDINPLSTFVYDVMCSTFDTHLFEQVALGIINKTNEDRVYKKYYCYRDSFILHNAKYRNNLCYECCFIGDKKQRFSCAPTQEDIAVIGTEETIDFKYSIPNKEFRDTDAFSSCLLNKIGSNIIGLYTKRNLYILSLIFNEILNVKDSAIKLQLMYAFIQTVHLSTRMCVPRSKQTKRDFSTSWGRSGYFVANSEMEMNPLLVFQSNCFGKQSVTSCLETLQSYVGKIKGKKVKVGDIINFDEDYDLWYGVVDSKRLSMLVPQATIDFVITDPPYGGLIQYLDLSNIWLSWLELYSDEYSPNYNEEITINKKNDCDKFLNDMTLVLKEIEKCLKPNAKIVLTFNNKKMEVWNSLLKSIQFAGFEIEKVIHQQNKRSGESNVLDKYGTSSSDFYIRCKTSKCVPTYLTKLQSVNIIADTAYDIILARNEPTPYQILLNGILAEISEQHFIFEDIDLKIQTILENKIGTLFSIEKNIDSLAGNYWWIADKVYDINDQNTLSNKIKKEIRILLENNNKATDNTIMTKIYQDYPNGMTPDISLVKRIIREFRNNKG